MLSFCPTLKKAFYRFLGESSPVQSSPVQSTSPVNKDAYTTLYSCPGLAVYRGSQFGPGTGPIFFADVGCSGSELSLLMCNRDVFGVTACTHSKDVGLFCEGTEKQNMLGNIDHFP